MITYDLCVLKLAFFQDLISKWRHKHFYSRGCTIGIPLYMPIL